MVVMVFSCFLKIAFAWANVVAFSRALRVVDLLFTVAKEGTVSTYSLPLTCNDFIFSFVDTLFPLPNFVTIKIIPPEPNCP